LRVARGFKAFAQALRPPRPRQPFMGVALSAALGIVAADRFALSPVWPLLASAIAAAVAWRRCSTAACWLLAATTFFTLHTLRFHGDIGRKLFAELAGGPRVIQAKGIVWSEPDIPAVFSRRTTCFFRLKLEQLDLGTGPQPASGQVNVAWAGAMPTYGDRVVLTGSGHNFQPTRNPGQFDFTRYLQRQGVFSELRVRFAADGRVESPGHGNPVQAFANAARRWIQSQLRTDLADSPEITALIESMVLGLRGETPEDVKELFQRTGTLHLFAVSGLNIAMLATIALTLLKPLRLPAGLGVCIVIPLLAFYAVVTGLSASGVRAAIMAALLLAAPIFDRRAIPYNSLAAAAFLILAWDTNQLFSVGFQFSFVLVLTIIFLARRIQHWCEPFGRPDAFLPRPLWSWPQRTGDAIWHVLAATIGITLAAWIGSLIFTAGYFHLFSPAAIFANLVAVPLAFAVLALGLATVLMATVWTTGAMLFSNANWLCAKTLLLVVKGFALLPGGHVYVEARRPVGGVAAELTLLDLGTGAAAHLRTGGRNWLIDCGDAANYGRTVLPYLRSRGVNRLDGLLLTHGDVQHIGAAGSLISDFVPRQIVDSVLRDRSPTRARLHRDLAARGIGKGLYQRGDTIRISESATARVLYPPVGLARQAADDKALVLRIESAGTRVLLMSDSGFSTEQWLLDNEPDLRSDLLVKGHHSKDLSGTPDFVRHVAPQAIVCGRSSSDDTAPPLDGWERQFAPTPIFRQDRTGAVRIDLYHGGRFEVRGFVGGQTFRSRAR
jgi:competence protein ComEC